MAGAVAAGTAVPPPVEWTKPLYVGHIAADSSGRVFGAVSNQSSNTIYAHSAAGGAPLWTKTMSNPLFGRLTGVGVRPDGDVVVSGSSHFPINGTSSGSQNTFVGRYGAGNGAHVLTVTTASGLEDWSEGMTLDSVGASLATGYSNGTLGGTPTLGGMDAFLVKHDAGGTLQWARRAGTGMIDVGKAVASDASNAIFLGGETQGTLPGATSAGGRDVFVQKYSAGGSLLWQKQFGTGMQDLLQSIETTSEGDAVYATTFADEFRFDRYETAVIARRDGDDGELLWARPFTGKLGSPATDAAMIVHDIAIDAHDRIFIGGEVVGTIGNGAVSAGGKDAFIAELSATGGDMLWSLQWGTNGADRVTSLVADDRGGLYVSGYGDFINSIPTNVQPFLTKFTVPEPSAALTALLLLAGRAVSRRHRRRLRSSP